MTEKIKDVVNVTDPPQGGTGIVAYTPDAAGLISQAIDKNVPVETMEKLLAMRRELKDEQAKEAFSRDFSAFQGECPIITKNKVVLNKDKKTIRYRYAPMDDIVSQVQGLLQKYGFSYTIHTMNERDPDGQRSKCVIYHVEGHSRESEFWAPIDHDAYMTDQQKWAAASTYGKRYAFCNALGILTGDEDNDAQSMDGNEDKSKPLVNGSAMKTLHDQILKDLSDSHFAGHIEFGGKQPDLDKVKIQMKEWLQEGPHSLKIMTESAENVARMLLIAQEDDSKDGALFVNPKDEKQLNDEDVQKVFEGEVVDVETEGNLTNG